MNEFTTDFLTLSDIVNKHVNNRLLRNFLIDQIIAVLLTIQSQNARKGNKKIKDYKGSIEFSNFTINGLYYFRIYTNIDPVFLEENGGTKEQIKAIYNEIKNYYKNI